MSDVVEEAGVRTAPDPHELEERRAARDLKHFAVKALVVAFIIVFVASFLSLIYSAVIQEKDLDTAFMGEMFKMVFDFLRFLLS